MFVQPVAGRESKFNDRLRSCFKLVVCAVFVVVLNPDIDIVSLGQLQVMYDGLPSLDDEHSVCLYLNKLCVS